MRGLAVRMTVAGGLVGLLVLALAAVVPMTAMVAMSAAADAGDDVARKNSPGGRANTPRDKSPQEGPKAKAPGATRPTTRIGLPLLAKRVLFIGNSYTASNDMPLMIQALAEEALERDEFAYETVLVGGATLEQHWFKTDARRMIRKSDWHYVVLQEQSMWPIAQPEAMYKYARLLDDEIQRAGAKTMFFLTWSRQDRPVDQDKLTDAYMSIARELKAQVAPVGLAWQESLRQKPRLALHAADKSHPTPAGSYLTACVFFATFYGKTPLGLPGRLIAKTKAGKQKIIANILPTDALFLQDVAWEAVRKAKAMKP